MKTLLSVTVILVFCTGIFAQSSQVDLLKRWGNTNTNLKQGGHIAHLDGVIYYSNPQDSFKLYRMNNDGTVRRRLSHDIPSQINVIGANIYYINQNPLTGKEGLYKISVNGRDRQFFDINSHYLRVHHTGIAFFILGDVLYQIDVTKPSKAMERVFVEKDEITNMFITEDFVTYTKYWENFSGNNRSGGMYVYNRRDRKISRLLSVNRIVGDFAVSDTRRLIFYSQEGGYYDNNTKRYPKGLYRVADNNTNPARLLNEDPLGYTLFFIDNWFYYRDVLKQLYRIDFEGKTNQLVSTLPGAVYEAGDYLIFYDGKKLIRTLKDGRMETVLR